MLDGPAAGLGARAQYHALLFRRRLSVTVEVYEHDPPVRLTERGNWGERPYQQCWVVVADGSGCTVTCELEYERPPGPMAAVADRLLVRRAFQRLLEAELAGLAAAGEAG